MESPMELIDYHDEDCKKLINEFQNYRKNGTLCDATIAVGNEKFPVHKVVLSATSSYFKKLFTDKKHNNVQLEKGVTEAAVGACLKFIYRQTCVIKMHEVGDLLQAATFFQLKELQQRCMAMIQNNIDVSNCTEIYKLPQAYERSDIETKAKGVMLKNADKLLQDDKYISELDADTLKMMVKSEDLSVSDESVIFEALLKWIALDKEERKDHFCEMLEFIRLPIMDQDYFSDVVWNCNHIQNECKKCKKYFTESAQYVLTNRRRNLKDYQLKKRMCVERSAQIKSDDCSRSHETAEVEEAKTTETAKEVEEEPAATQLSEIIIVSKSELGGHLSVSKFDAKYDSLSDYIPKQEVAMNVDPRLFCHHNDILYLFDACNSRRLFRYKDGKWIEFYSLLTTARNFSHAHLIAYKDVILVVGGWNTNVYCFSVTKEKWIHFPDLVKIYGPSSSVVYRGCVYVTGGWSERPLSSRTVEKFDSLTKKWQMMPRMNQGRCLHASAVHQDKIIVAGGSHGSELLTSVETFHQGDSAWTWSFMESLNVRRNCFSLFVKDSRLYAFGGGRQNGTSLYETFDEKTETWKKSTTRNKQIIYCKVLLK